MKEQLKSVMKPRVLRYITAGGLAFVVEYTGFIGLFYGLHLHVNIANSSSFLAGLVTSFYMHQKWSFAGNHALSKRHQLTGYVALALINLLLTNLMIRGLTDWLDVPASVAKILCMGGVVVWNYIILSRVLFKHHEVI